MSALAAARERVRGVGDSLARGAQARFMGLHSDPLLHKHREVVYHLSANEQARVGVGDRHRRTDGRARHAARTATPHARAAPLGGGEDDAHPARGRRSRGVTSPHCRDGRAI